MEVIAMRMGMTGSLVVLYDIFGHQAGSMCLFEVPVHLAETNVQ